MCQELLLGLTWSILQYGRISADIGITVHTAEDIIECMQPRQKATLDLKHCLARGATNAGEVRHVRALELSTRTWQLHAGRIQANVGMICDI